MQFKLIKINSLFSGKSPNILKHRVRWEIQNVLTDARVTPDPCFEKNDCVYEEIDGTVSLSTVFVSKSLPLVSANNIKILLKYCRISL